jgi:hypothetical protein
MDAVNSRRATALFALGALALSTIVPAQAQAPAMDPAAVEIFKRMTDYLGTLQRFSVNVQNTFEDVIEPSQKIQFDVSASVVVQRPNKLRAERKSDLANNVIYYDGKTITIYNPKDNNYAVVAAPDNIEDTPHFARDSLDIVPPVGDLVYRNAFDLLMANVTSGMVVGKSIIGGVKYDHLAFSGPVVDWQIWIADGAKPLPRKYVITTKDDPAQPQYMVLMSNWNVAPKVNDALFRFKPPQGARKTDLTGLTTTGH